MELHLQPPTIHLIPEHPCRHSKNGVWANAWAPCGFLAFALIKTTGLLELMYSKSFPDSHTDIRPDSEVGEKWLLRG